MLLKYGLFRGMEYGDVQQSVSTSTLRTDPVKSLRSDRPVKDAQPTGGALT